MFSKKMQNLSSKSNDKKLENYTFPLPAYRDSATKLILIRGGFVFNTECHILISTSPTSKIIDC